MLFTDAVALRTRRTIAAGVARLSEQAANFAEFAFAALELPRR
ncbi:hypothetical protein [Nocardia acidivorans]|nr:hypothetical protein [Nocardia acidivorans]